MTGRSVLGLLLVPCVCWAQGSLELGADVEVAVGDDGYKVFTNYVLEDGVEIEGATVDWGDGTSDELTVVQDTSQLFAAKLWLEVGEFDVEVEMETTAGSVQDTVRVTVTDVAPVLEFLPDLVMGQSGEVVLGPVEFSDPGVLGEHQATVDWGDGTVEVIEVDGEAQEVSARHVYAEGGPFEATLRVFDEGGEDVQGFVVHPPLLVDEVLPGADGGLELAWSGGGDRYRVLRRDGLTAGSPVEEVLLGAETRGSFATPGRDGFFVVESLAGQPELDVSVAVEVGRGEGDPMAQGVAFATVTERATGLPADPEAIEFRIGVGLDSEVPVEVVRTGAGTYTGTFQTNIAGTGEIEVELPLNRAGVFETFQVPPGAIDSLQVSTGPFVFPDGETPFVVSVAAVDVVGNPAGEGLSEFEVESELPFAFEYSECGEGEFHFTSTVPGRYPIVIREVGSGLETELEAVFPVAAPRRFLDAPVGDIGFEGATLRVPVEVYVPPGWGFRELNLDVFFDDAMAAIAGFAGVQDGDPADGVGLLGAEAFPSDGGTTVAISLERSAAVPGRVATVWLDFDTATGGGDPPPDGGVVAIEGLRSDVPHPLFDDPVVPIDEDNSTVLISTCTMKAMKVGHAIYVRTELKKKQTARTDAEICAAHNAANDALFQACIYLDKTIIKDPVKGKVLRKNISSNLGNAQLKKQSIYAKTSRVMAKVARELTKRKIPLRKKMCDPKKEVQCVIVTLFNHDIQGGKAVANDEKAAVVIESQKGKMPALTNGRSLAHEFVHVFGHVPAATGTPGGHFAGKDNLMTPTDKGGKGTDLETRQIDLIRQSKYLVDCLVGFYQGEERARVRKL